ncbi:MAG TPA: FCD domain-containing protein [Candidatus Stackebrandtia excrementipullorum]|nr:FCD domain-containing protein [Candidatus Stackebrandtia excrementipullorum]
MSDETPVPTQSRHGPRVLSRGLHAQVLHTLGREIVDAELSTGEVLNSEQLCERFSVSRSVIRECLRALESMGMVNARPQVGTRVSDPSNWDLLNPQVVLWRGQGTQYLQQMHEILELRLGVETAAAGLAAHRMMRDDVRVLKDAVTTMTKASEVGDDEAFLAADITFHNALLKGAGNAVIAQFADTVAAVLRTRSGDYSHTFNHRTKHSMENHMALAEALEARDPGEASKWARVIVQDTLTEFQERSSGRYHSGPTRA